MKTLFLLFFSALVTITNAQSTTENKYGRKRFIVGIAAGIAAVSSKIPSRLYKRMKEQPSTGN